MDLPYPALATHAQVEVPSLGDEQSDAAEVKSKLQQLRKSKGSMKASIHCKLLLQHVANSIMPS